jgi:hypothetical protein
MSGRDWNILELMKVVREDDGKAAKHRRQILRLVYKYGSTGQGRRRDALLSVKEMLRRNGLNKCKGSS